MHFPADEDLYHAALFLAATRNAGEEKGKGDDGRAPKCELRSLRSSD
jgi:hypothetical protein